MSIYYKERSNEEELMDDFTLEGDSFEESLNQIANINKWLGGNAITLNALKTYFKEVSQENYTIVDVGCGNGDMCRNIAILSKKLGLNVKIIGIDANVHTIQYAEKLSVDYTEIEYLALDIFSDEFKALKFDVILATLTMHHFENSVIKQWLRQVLQQVQHRIIINDLERSKIAHSLFQLVSFVFRFNEMNRIDGAISIKRGFLRKEIHSFNNLLKEQHKSLRTTVKWKWAFRYLWEIKKL